MTPDPLALAWLAEVWPEHDWASAEFHHGCFHDVAVRPPVVARVTRHGEQPERMARQRRVLTLLESASLPFAIPRPLSEPVTRHGRTGMLTSLVPGTPCPEASWPEVAGWFESALHAFAAASRYANWLDQLPEPRAWAGGAEWPVLVRDRLVPLIPRDLRAPALGFVDEALQVEGSVRGLVHGDLGPHNLLWVGDEVSGLIDFDHACAGDPALDVAVLLGHFGPERVGEIVDDELLRRAKAHRATLGLQLAAAAELLGDTGLRDHALRNFEARIGLFSLP